MKLKTYIGAKVRRWRRDGNGRALCWCWIKATILWAPRVWSKGYVAQLLCIVIQVAPSLLFLKSPQLTFGNCPTKFLTVEESWRRIGNLKNLSVKCAVLRLRDFTGIPTCPKT